MITEIDLVRENMIIFISTMQTFPHMLKLINTAAAFHKYWTSLAHSLHFRTENDEYLFKKSFHTILLKEINCLLSCSVRDIPCNLITCFKPLMVPPIGCYSDTSQ